MNDAEAERIIAKLGDMDEEEIAALFLACDRELLRRAAKMDGEFVLVDPETGSKTVLPLQTEDDERPCAR